MQSGGHGGTDARRTPREERSNTGADIVAFADGDGANGEAGYVSDGVSRSGLTIKGQSEITCSNRGSVATGVCTHCVLTLITGECIASCSFHHHTGVEVEPS